MPFDPSRSGLEQFAAREAQCEPACAHPPHYRAETMDRSEHCLACGALLRIGIVDEGMELTFAPGPGPAISPERIEPGEGEPTGEPMVRS